MKNEIILFDDFVKKYSPIKQLNIRKKGYIKYLIENDFKASTYEKIELNNFHVNKVWSVLENDDIVPGKHYLSKGWIFCNNAWEDENIIVKLKT